jgi:hypothetical protein
LFFSVTIRRMGPLVVVVARDSAARHDAPPIGRRE